MTAGSKNVSAGTSTPRPPTPSVPLTKLLGRRGLTGTRRLLALATTKASMLRDCTSTSTTATATSATAAAASATAARKKWQGRSSAQLQRRTKTE
ncbi:unnamed protein product [Closterium sp. NIES-53]